mgnify:CR=1 FL=1
MQAFGLPKGMIQTVDFAYTVKQTYLGKPDKSELHPAAGLGDAAGQPRHR